MKVQYFPADFDGLKQSLRRFAESYYPDIYTDFSEASPGQMFIDMASYVGDVLGVEINRAMNENFLSRASDRKNIYELASTYGYHPSLASVATGFVSVYQVIPSSGSGAASAPDMRYALYIDQNMVLGSRTGIQFVTTKPTNFSVSSRVTQSVYSVDSLGEPTYYLLETSVPVRSGKIKTQEFTITNPEKYLQLELTDRNIAEIVSVTDSDGNTWYEVPYLAQDTVFYGEENTVQTSPTLYQFQNETPYLLRAKKTSRRFRRIVTENEKIVLQFGSGVASSPDEMILPNPDLIGSGVLGSDAFLTSAIDPSNFIFTKTYGEIPHSTVITVSYLEGYGVEANVPAQEIKNILAKNAFFLYTNLDNSQKNIVLSSLVVNNRQPARGARTKESIESIRQGALGALHAQRRAVTDLDYVVRAMSMPSRFGRVAKAWAQRNPDDNFTVDLFVLGQDSNGHLTQLNEATKQNLRTYLTSFRILTDSVNIRDGYIINLGLRFAITVLPRFNQQQVLAKCIQRLKDKFSLENMGFRQPIILKDVVAELSLVDGVQNIPELPVFFVKNIEGYSQVYYPLDVATRNGVIYPSADPAIFEIRNLDIDIEGRIANL